MPITSSLSSAEGRSRNRPWTVRQVTSTRAPPSGTKRRRLTPYIDGKRVVQSSKTSKEVDFGGSRDLERCQPILRLFGVPADSSGFLRQLLAPQRGRSGWHFKLPGSKWQSPQAAQICPSTRRKLPPRTSSTSASRKPRRR